MSSKTSEDDRHTCHGTLISRYRHTFGRGGCNSVLHRERDDKSICTTPGELCAGETETESDEPPLHLPTTRIISSSSPTTAPNPHQRDVTTILINYACFLSAFPALFGLAYNLSCLYNPPPPSSWPGTRPPPDSVDFFVAALWALLTAYQALSLTTGILARWKLYYPPLNTLVRLIALQGICWPATRLTLSLLEREGPMVTWAVVGTTTCITKSVQIWVTSNLWHEEEAHGTGRRSGHRRRQYESPMSTLSARVANLTGFVIANVGSGLFSVSSYLFSDTYHAPSPAGRMGRPEARGKKTYMDRLLGSSWRRRRWDWREVGIRCLLPAGILYFVMVWAEELRKDRVVRSPGY